MTYTCCAHGACVQGNDSTWPAIIAIELTGNQLTGELPSQWARDDYFDNLRLLLLGDNNLSGQVRVLGPSAHCTTLWLDDGELSCKTWFSAQATLWTSCTLKACEALFCHILPVRWTSNTGKVGNGSIR